MPILDRHFVYLFFRTITSQNESVEARNTTPNHFTIVDKGISKGTEIHKITDIPLSTIYDNLKKLKENNTVSRKKGSGRPKKITGKFSKNLGQYVRRDTSVSTRTLTKKLLRNGLEVSHVTVSRHLI